jgi:hypothetical protein
LKQFCMDVFLLPIYKYILPGNMDMWLFSKSLQECILLLSEICLLGVYTKYCAISYFDLGSHAPHCALNYCLRSHDTYYSISALAQLFFLCQWHQLGHASWDNSIL